MTRRPRRRLGALAEFLHEEAVGGLVLLAATAGALLWANAAGHGYETFWHEHVAIGIGDAELDLDLRHWVNDGLMAVFFFVVGLEIKRELAVGELRDPRAAALPVVAAIGGVALPALIFVAITGGTPDARGWAMPAATDIAFAVGILALLGSRVPAGAKLFLLTIAIVDDLLAILIIAIFYADAIALGWLALALGAFALTAIMQRVGVTRIWPYVPVGVVAWVAVHESGVHATIAGVLLGVMTPAGLVAGRDVLGRLEHGLHPVSAFAIVPLFALANAGVDLGGGLLGSAAGSRLAWAVAVGLVVGKTLGIAGSTFLAVRAGWGALPAGVRGAQVWGLAMLGGIGFTVSLFIAQLAYEDEARVALAKVGVLAGSAVSALLGVTALALAGRRAVDRAVNTH
jgi:NhaA family Na+:H+ antiporter